METMSSRNSDHNHKRKRNESSRPASEETRREEEESLASLFFVFTNLLRENQNLQTALRQELTRVLEAKARNRRNARFLQEKLATENEARGLVKKEYTDAKKLIYSGRMKKFFPFTIGEPAVTANTISNVDHPTSVESEQKKEVASTCTDGNTKGKQSAWNPEEDKLLLFYFAAMGPQYVFEGDQVSHLIQRFFPGKTHAQVSARPRASLLNPSFIHRKWDHEEEQQLAILMRIYSSSSSAVYYASNYMQRSVKSVRDKWERALNPEYTTKPMNRRQDELLRKVVRENPQLGWRDISDQFFPDRHPQRLANRWSEIANREEIKMKAGSKEDTVVEKSELGEVTL